MKYYLAPLEGITNYIYRRTYHQFFVPADKYFTPFVSPHTNSKLKGREKREILPEHNAGRYTVPQVLTNQAEDFVRVAKELRNYGYEEVNLNLGCPSGTVVSKKKGSGFLEFPSRLDQFLDETFEQLEGTDVKISLKTRLGLLDEEEFEPILEIYNKYPVHELIIHPRVRADFYKNPVHLDAFEKAVKLSKNPVCYNGDIFTVKGFKEWRGRFPEVESIMLGRGVIANPGLIQTLKGGKTLDKELFRAFHDQLVAEYESFQLGDRNVLFKMKELWFYMGSIFEDSKKMEKMIKKAQTLDKYKEAVRLLLAGCDLKEDGGFHG